ncbi:trypsin-1-like isoform X2 [Chironomus tepperi]|uniref:trypsin-1-like isoform X2 n=1 Tax=Chironomus tepperi TaxID=113505 RepID=UPI00391F000E
MKVSCLLLLMLFCFANSDDPLPCRFNDGSFGKCVDIKNCKSLYGLYRQGTVRVRDLPICDPVRRLICCPRISSKKCKEYGRSAIESISSPNSVATCQFSPTSSFNEGTRHLVTRFYNEWARDASGSHNREASVLRQFEFPHQAILGYQINDEVKWICSGSLISLDFVLTAGRCISSIEYGAVKFVKLGAHNLNDGSKSMILTVKQTFKHSKDRISALQNDIALLKLQGPVRSNGNIWPICLPTRPYYDTRAIRTGFGEIPSQNLLKDVVSKFDQQVCKDSYGDRFNETTMLCYGHQTERTSNCIIDEGGPLQVSNDDQVNCTYTQIGIASFGHSNCDSTGVPSVYVNVYKYINWIEGIVWKDEA